ncbi:hypothetical protein ACGYK5_17810 [Sulfitobacter sp. 1A16787]|uniref:hypothetical protein n=1 Tax=Sulfitobacter sp. 1A16787 TaxID=3368571 RepID=UPI0037459FF3
MPVFADRVKVSTATTGTGTLTLGAPLAGFQSFADGGVGNGQAVTYVIEDGLNVEIGTGTYSAGTLTRSTVHRSIVGGVAGSAKLNLSGRALVYVTARGSELDHAAAGYLLRHLTKGTVTGGNTCDFATGNFFRIALDANKTISFTNVPATGVHQWQVILDATGTRTVAWSGVAKVYGDVALEPPADGLSKTYVFTSDNGTIYGGMSA